MPYSGASGIWPPCSALPARPGFHHVGALSLTGCTDPALPPYLPNWPSFPAAGSGGGKSMEQDCTGSRESRDILKVKRDVDNAESSHSPQLSLFSLPTYRAARKTVQKRTLL